VLVHIVEPHMYEVDDAVAKIDGYIVSVVGGGPFVGEKRLVRIEEAGRTSATASLVGEGNGGPETSSEDGEERAEDGSGSGSGRRRGRRGGRRRSKAKASEAA
jgi:ribonuclease G